MAADIDIFPNGETSLRAHLLSARCAARGIFRVGAVWISDPQRSRRELGRHRQVAAAR